MGRMRGCLWLTAGIILALLAGLVAYVTLARVSTSRSGMEPSAPNVAVVVAKRAIAVRSVLTKEDLDIKQIPIDASPEGAVSQIQGAEGKISLVDVFPGEIIVSQRLLDPNIISGNGRMAVVVAEDQVLMSLPTSDLMSNTSMLKPGDHVDLLYSLEFPTNRGMPSAANTNPNAVANSGSTSQEKELATFDLLQNVTIAAIVSRNAPPASGGQDSSAPAVNNSAEALFFTVKPQDALIIKYVQDAGGKLDIVLRAPGAERPYSSEPVDYDYLINKFKIPIAVGR
jgi:pilus assembly protein CpaB